MLNWAVRYFPILRILKRRSVAGERLLEVGSGSFGLATFYRRRFVGCDVDFPWPPREPMLPVRCSAAALPFGDASFGVVVVSDVLEHVPPEHRLTVVQEALRVARKVVVFAFPSGSAAYGSDRNFHNYLKKQGIPICDWLEEHMRYPFPDRTLFEGLPQEWSVESFGNEHVGFHNWVNRRELSGRVNQLFTFILKVVPSLVEALLQLADRSPFYRLIVVVSRKPPGEVRPLVDTAT